MEQSPSPAHQGQGALAPEPWHSQGEWQLSPLLLDPMAVSWRALDRVAPGLGQAPFFFFNEKIILTSHSYKTGPPAGPKKPLPETSTELLCSSQPPGPPPGPVPRPQQHLQADQIPQIPGAESGLTVPLWGPNESAQKDGGRGSQPRSADVGVSQAWGSRHEDGRTENWAHGHCYGLMCVPPNSQVEVLTSSPWEGDYI